MICKKNIATIEPSRKNFKNIAEQGCYRSCNEGRSTEGNF